MSAWVLTSEKLPPDNTPVLIVRRGVLRIGELRWERPSFEDTWKAYRYWDDPEDDGQSWEWHEITHWALAPELPPAPPSRAGAP